MGTARHAQPNEHGESLYDTRRGDAPPTAFRALPPAAPPPVPALQPITLLAQGTLATLALWGIGRGVSLLPAFSTLPEPAGVPLALAWLLVGVASATAMRVPRDRLAWPLVLAVLASIALFTLTATAQGWGLATPGLATLGLLVIVACLGAGAVAGAGVAAAALASLLVLAWAPGWLPWRAATAAAPPALHLVALAVAIAGSLVCGLALAHVVRRRQQATEEREQQLLATIAMAVDATWEIDAGYRLVSAHAAGQPDVAPMLATLVGSVPWELDSFDCDPDTLDALQADLETRVPFRDLPIRWRSRSGQWRHFRVSGSPRFDKRRQFRGYSGIAREITAQVQAFEALAATETRYQELFSRIPTALVLHRNGLVLDANPAALQLFGYDDLESMIGRDALEAYEGGDSQERERRRMELLETMAVGDALPVADFRLLVRSGKRMSVRATGVRVQAEGGPATLSFYVDDTERKRAEEAVRRSEALLSHLVATSPDVITLTDLATGRYAMVNHTFERATGYSAAEVIGRTSGELGIWAHPEQRQEFVDAVRAHGSTSEVACEFVAKDGHHLQMLVSGAVFAMDRRTYLVINGRDISEQERSRLEREAILENAWVGIAVTRERKLIQSNARLEALYGYPAGTMIGVPARSLWADAADHDAFVARESQRLMSGSVVETETLARRRDGSTFMARIVGRAIEPSRRALAGFLWVVDDVSEQHHARDELARARDQAEAANRAKTAFLANTSHELRTPLNGMLGLAQLARDPQVDPERRARYLDQIVDNAQALAAILSDVLDLSKIEAGKLQLEQGSFWLPEVLATLENTYAPFAAARGLQLRVEIDASARCHVRGDALRVRQIVSNFLSNGLKFTEQGHVALSARRQPGGRLRIEVEDSGPGVDPRIQARLFEPFTQADESTTRRFGGTGLGLSICRELAQLMGGEVGIRSELGHGACFWAELDLPEVVVDFTSATPAAPAAPAAAAQDLGGLRVLMVEDNPVNMLIGVAIVERWGASVEQAHDGRQAVELVQRAFDAGTPFDVVLMDVQMPVMSGYEATRELRRRPCGRELPIIALTAAALVTEREEARAAGMDDFLTKPIDADKLRATLGRHAGGRIPAGF